MATDYAVVRRLEVLISLMQRIAPPLQSPSALGKHEAIEEKESDTVHFIKNRQHFVPVPMGKGIDKQHFTVQEDGATILDVDVPFDPSTGAEPAEADLPTYWTEVGKNVVLTLTYIDTAGTASTPFSETYLQDDTFVSPSPIPLDLGPTTPEAEEDNVDARPTT